MQIESFKVFCDLVDTASFSEAAARNGVTQSAVSQQIRALEKRFGVSFFERGKKNFAITPEGQVFDEAARSIVAVYGGIGDRLQDLQNRIEGTLRIATIYSIGLHELPPLIEEFRSRFPSVRLEVDYRRANQVYVDVTEGQADLGLVAYPKARKGVVTDVFSRDRLVVVCGAGHPLAGRKRLRLQDLDGQKFIAFSSDLPTRRALDRILRDGGLSITPVMEFDEIETVKRAVEVEGGVSIVPVDAVRREVAAGVLSASEVGGAEMWRPLGIVKERTRAVSPAMREFLHMLAADPKRLGPQFQA